MKSGFRCCMHLVHFRPNIFIISLQAQLHFTSIFSGQTCLVMNPEGLAEGSHFKMFLVSHTKYHQSVVSIVAWTFVFHAMIVG